MAREMSHVTVRAQFLQCGCTALRIGCLVAALMAPAATQAAPGDSTVKSRLPAAATPKRPPPDDSPYGRARAAVEQAGAKPTGKIDSPGGPWGAFVHLLGAGFDKATGVIGLWYPNDDITQAPTMRTSVSLLGRPRPDALRIQIPLDPARTGSRGSFAHGKLHVVLTLPNAVTVYAGIYTVGETGAPAAANPAPMAPKLTTGLSIDEKIRGVRPAFRPQVVRTEAIVLAGTRRPPFVPQTLRTETIQLTGTRRPPFIPPVIRTEPLTLTGTRSAPRTPPALKSDRAIQSDALRDTVAPVTPVTPVTPR